MDRNIFGWSYPAGCEGVPDDYEADFSQKIAELRALLDSIKVVAHPVTVDELFNRAPEGDFKWDDEAGFEIPWACDDEECGAGWHRGTYYTDIGRKDGKRFIDVQWDSHSDGDAQPDWYWEEGEDSTELLKFLSEMSDSHFRRWAEYWLDCAETGKDPLSEFIDPFDFSVESCLDAAEEYIRDIEM